MKDFQKIIDLIVIDPKLSFENGAYKDYKENMLNLIQHIHDYLDDENIGYNKQLVSNIETFLEESDEKNVSNFEDFSQKCVDYFIEIVSIMNIFDPYFGEEGWKEHFGYNDIDEEYE